MSEDLAILLGVCERPTTLGALKAAWRTACEQEGRALRAWCDGEGSYEAFAAALDREQAAAEALAECRA